MKDLIVVVGLVLIAFPIVYYWLQSNRATSGLTELTNLGLKPDLVCHFLSGGYKVAFDTDNQKIAFVNVEFRMRSKNPLDGREFKTYRLSQAFDYSAVEVLEIHRSLEDDAPSRSGSIRVKFSSPEDSDSYSEARMSFTHHDTEAIRTLERCWPTARIVGP